MSDLGFKSTYSDQWDRAAKQTKRVIDDLISWFAHEEFLAIRAGHGALDSELVPNGDHEKGSPDIFIEYKGDIIAAVEVTGSEKVNFPCAVWIGKHKMDYALKVEFPISFVVNYPNEQRWISARMVDRYAENPESRKIMGTIEYYHILKPHHTQIYKSLKFWVEGCIECRKKDEHEKEMMIDEKWQISNRDPSKESPEPW